MNGLKSVGSELLGPPNGIAFPSLKVLEYKDMEGWEEWSTVNIGGNDRNAASFPCLNEISIRNCPELYVVTIDQLIPSLRVLEVDGCSIVVLRKMIVVSLSITRLKVENIRGLTCLDEVLLEHLKAVEYLRIKRCDELTYLWESEAEACKILVNLQELEVTECKNLVRLVEKKVDLEKISMESLRKVSLLSCERLESYDCGSDNIEKLEISDCGSMKSLTFPPAVDDDDLPSSTLKSLEIWECKNVEVNWLITNFLSSLTSLCLYSIPNVKLLPEGCLVHLTELSIGYCENIEWIPEKGYGFLPNLCLKSLQIMFCQNIKSFPHEKMQSLTSLEEMMIMSCPNMDRSFPSGFWPPNLKELRIGGLKRAMSEWGMLQIFPHSLVYLFLHGENSGAVSFARGSASLTSCAFLFPSSLTSLEIWNFEELETISNGMEGLTSLKELSIHNCPKLRDLPETLLPSLSCLWVESPSAELRKKCESSSSKGRKKGNYYWPVISQIPRFLMWEGELGEFGLTEMGE